MGAPIDAKSAARHMCNRSGWTLTNLELQKMLYLAQMIYMGREHERLMNTTFEAWDFGPVSPEVYQIAKFFGSDPIAFWFSDFKPVKDEQRSKLLDAAYDQLSQRTAGQLVNITHWHKGAWARNYKPGVKGVKIPDADIIREFNERQA